MTNGWTAEGEISMVNGSHGQRSSLYSVVDKKLEWDVIKLSAGGLPWLWPVYLYPRSTSTEDHHEAPSDTKA